MQAVPYTHLKHLYIDGRWEKAQAAEPVINPATEREIGHAPTGDSIAASAAIAAARTAFDSGPWPNLAMSERAAILKRLHSALDSKPHESRRPTDSRRRNDRTGACGRGRRYHWVQFSLPLEPVENRSRIACG